jgi:hypothetical protein
MRGIWTLKPFSRGLLLAASPLAILISSPANAQEVPLGPIDVFGSMFTEGGLLGGGDLKATGTTKLSKEQLKIRGDGSGDPNEALKLLPNVQFQSHTSNNKVNKKGGVTINSEQDLRPAELSISGGRIYENNFLLDGVEINAIGGAFDNSTSSTTGASTGTLGDTAFARADSLYYGHSQSVYIDSAIIGSMTVHDSNISAKFGRFMGGVVEYEIMDPKTDRAHMSLEILHTRDNYVKFKLATEDGENPKDRTPPDFSKTNWAASFSAPLSPSLSVLTSFSRKQADTTKQRHYKFIQHGDVHTETESFNMLGKAKLKTDLGDFTLQTTYAPYTHEWDSTTVLNSQTDIKGDGWSNYLKHEYKTGGFGALFGAGKIENQLFFNTNQQGRDADETVYTLYKKQYIKGGNVVHVSNNLDDICQNDINSDGSPKLTSCSVGAVGDLYQNQKDTGLKSNWQGQFLGQQLLVGGGYKKTSVQRERPEDVTYYGSTKYGGNFTCEDPDDPLCLDDNHNGSSDQYAYKKVINRAFDKSIDIDTLDTFVEYDMKFGMFGLRAGGRADYESYLKNLNFSPRLLASLEPFKGLVFSGGFNRYYSNSMLAYAIRDLTPPSETYEREKDGSGVVHNYMNDDLDGDGYADKDGGDGWWGTQKSNTTPVSYFYRFKDAGLNTPYIDERTLSVSLNDPLLGGLLRGRYINRKGKDQFARSPRENQDTGPHNEQERTYTLTNEGYNSYESYSLEYAKYWNNLNVGPLQSLGFSGSATWAERHASQNSYFDEAEFDEYIIYNGEVYSKADFKSVTGNHDIPVRLTFTANATLFNDWLNIWSTANVSLSYEGVIDSGSNQSTCGPNDETCDVYEDYSFKPDIVVNIGGDIRLAKGEAGDLKLNFKVNNLLDSVGNYNAGDDNPYKKGRQFWVGMKYTY